MSHTSKGKLKWTISLLNKFHIKNKVWIYYNIVTVTQRISTDNQCDLANIPENTPLPTELTRLQAALLLLLSLHQNPNKPLLLLSSTLLCQNSLPFFPRLLTLSVQESQLIFYFFLFFLMACNNSPPFSKPFQHIPSTRVLPSLLLSPTIVILQWPILGQHVVIQKPSTWQNNLHKNTPQNGGLQVVFCFPLQLKIKARVKALVLKGIIFY